ncbi:MAG: hypothetical protein VW226_13865 [Rhodospirillaceae bacterium]|jgi:hypothetical protein
MGILKKWWFWVIVVVVIGAISNSGNENSGDSASSSSSKSESKPDPVTENRPADEAAFIAAVQEGQTAAKGAENDMQKGAAKANRDKAVCAALSSGMRVSNWTGTIADIDSNSEGKGVLSIKLANDIHIQTWNNALSDIGSDTLMEPGSDLFNKVAGMKKKMAVTFSGSFIQDDDSCIDEQSLSLDGKIKDPEFTFRFSDVNAL